MPPRHFSVEQADQLIPRLTTILGELTTLNTEHERLQRQLVELGLKTQSNGHGLEGMAGKIRLEMQRIASQMKERIERVHSLGCDLKDVAQGLIDFRTVIGGTEVYLCWKLGEERIEWWHELNAGFSGRQPLPVKRVADDD